MLVDGRALAREVEDTLRNVVASRVRPPHIRVLMVGDDPASAQFVRLKTKVAARVGIEVQTDHFRGGYFRSGACGGTPQLWR